MAAAKGQLVRVGGVVGQALRPSVPIMLHTPMPAPAALSPEKARRGRVNLPINAACSPAAAAASIRSHSRQYMHGQRACPPQDGPLSALLLSNPVVFLRS